MFHIHVDIAAYSGLYSNAKFENAISKHTFIIVRMHVILIQVQLLKKITAASTMHNAC